MKYNEPDAPAKFSAPWYQQMTDYTAARYDDDYPETPWCDSCSEEVLSVDDLDEDGHCKECR